MGAAQSADDEPTAEEPKKRRTRAVKLDARANEGDGVRSGGADISPEVGRDKFDRTPGAHWTGGSLAAGIADHVLHSSPSILKDAPGHPGGVAIVSAPAGGWSSFTAKDARGRTHGAMRSEVEHVLKRIAWESDHGRTSINIYCATVERCEMLAAELRQRMFTVINPVRSCYAEKARRLLELRGRVALPSIPNGIEPEEFLLRLLYTDPLKAELNFAAHIGTFRVPVHISLDARTENGHSYYFGATHHGSLEHCRDSRLLLRASW
mmetsp:Transcript_31047/g.89727  ORF Transcript_31047/g.89727 Transcript_31047/m.89727 type:complete len:265 (+) Transcript_31047:47-841(+)